MVEWTVGLLVATFSGGSTAAYTCWYYRDKLPWWLGGRRNAS